MNLALYKLNVGKENVTLWRLPNQPTRGDGGKI